MFKIEQATEAMTRLHLIVIDPDTYQISIAVKNDSQIMLKQNEGMWSHPLDVTSLNSPVVPAPREPADPWTLSKMDYDRTVNLLSHLSAAELASL